MESLAVECALVKKLTQEVKDLKRNRTPDLAMSNWSMMTAVCIACILDCDFVAGADWLKNSKRRGDLWQTTWSFQRWRDYWNTNS